MFQLAVFDLDGTLLDTLGDLCSAVNHALKTFGFPERSLEEVRHFIGNGVKVLMKRAVPEGTDAVTEEECLACFRQYYLEHMTDTTAPFKGVEELLRQLRQRGVAIAVVSNKLHEGVAGLCRDYFPGLIDLAVGVSHESERKPEPVNVIRAMAHFGVSREETVYIGDSEVDVQTAKNAGVRCIGVEWGFRSKETLEEAEAWRIAASTEEVLHLIEE